MPSRKTKNLKTSIKAAAFLLAAAQLPLSTGQASDAEMQALTESLRPRYVVGTEMPRYKLEERMAHYGVPGVAIGVIRNGKLIHAEGYGVLQVGGTEPVDGDSLFSAGSVSKVAAASLLLKMHTDGMVDIDQNIEAYLKDWKLPTDGARSGKDVTLRMLLSHTGGFNIHGFGDFLPGADLPTVYDTLNGAAPATHAPLTFLFEPGVRYKYSGGGYTLAQLVTTDVSGKDYPLTAKEQLFDVVGMSNSSFANPLPESTPNVAKAHNREGEPVALPRGYEAMPEMAASGLWTSARDLGKLVASLIRSYRGEEGLLSQALAGDMMTVVAPSEHGLGPRIEGKGTDLLFHHGGANNSYRSWIEGHLATGDGLVVLTNGTRGNALFVEIRNAAADAFGWQINKPVFVQPVSVPQPILESFAGQYAPDETFPHEHRRAAIGWFYDSPLNIELEDGKLWLSRPNRDRKSELVPTGPNRFLVQGFNQRIGVAEVVFHRDSSKSTPSMTLELSGARSLYERSPDRDS